MRVRPLGNRVLLKLIEEEEKRTQGGILLPETARNEKVLRGEVVGMGTDEKIALKKGDCVLVARYGGTELELGQERLLIVKATDVLAVVKEK